MREGEPFGVHLVTPNSSNANNVRNVNSDGTLNNNNAWNGNRGVRPLRWKMRSSRRKPKAEYHHQRKVYPAAAIHSGGKYRIADAGAFRAEIEKHVAAIGLSLNNKTNIYPLRNGVDFLGFHTYLTETGAVIRKVRRRSKNNMKRKLKKMRGLVERGKITTATVEQSYQSWRGHAAKGNCYHLIRRTDHYYNRLFNSKEAEKCQKH